MPNPVDDVGLYTQGLNSQTWSCRFDSTFHPFKIHLLKSLKIVLCDGEVF